MHLFKSLGHLVHLIQDMAQPEHTRNDQHLFTLFDTAPSLYERWGDEQATKNLVYLETFMTIPYPTVDLPRYSDYFLTDGTSGTQAGAGLADFSNRNFITQDTAYQDASWSKCFNYDFPNLYQATVRLEKDVSEQVYEIEPVTKMIKKTVVKVDEWILSYPVADQYTQQTDHDIFHAFYSSLDMETRLLGKRVYSLGPASFDSRAGLLLPRAVQYSAGFMKKFFRGNLDAEWIKTTEGWDLKLTNLSPDRIDSGRLVVNYCPGTQYLNSDADCDTILDASLSSLLIHGLNAGESVTIALPSIPSLHAGDDVRRFERRIAIRGTLGTEADEVIGLVQAPTTLPARKVDNFDSFYPGAQPGFAVCANFNGVTGMNDGCLLYDPQFTRVDSMVYAQRYRGRRLWYWWLTPINKPGVRVINGPATMDFTITYSPDHLVDWGNYVEFTLQPYEQRVIESPFLSVGRITISPRSSQGWFFIDDVTWE